MDNAPLPGVALLSAHLSKHSLTRAEFSRRASQYAHVDRVTLVNLLEGNLRRVSVQVASAIEWASTGEVPAESWIPPEALRLSTEPNTGEAAA